MVLALHVVMKVIHTVLLTILHRMNGMYVCYQIVLKYSPILLRWLCNIYISSQYIYFHVKASMSPHIDYL